MSVTKDFSETISAKDFLNQEGLKTLKGWAQEEGEPVDEMEVEVSVEVDREDGSFDYPGYGGGTHKQWDYKAEGVQVYLVDENGESSEDISALLTPDCISRLEQRAIDKTDDDEFDSSDDYEPDFD